MIEQVRTESRAAAPARLAAVVAVLMVLVAAAGCSSSGGSNASASPTASANADVQWAGDICTGVTDVQTAVKNLGTGIKVNVQDGAAALESAKTQVTAQLTAVQDAAQQLVTTVTTVPEATSSEVKAKQQTLSSQADALKSALADVESAASDVAGVSSAQGFVTAVGDMVVPLTTAALDAKLLVSTLKSYTSSTKDTLKTAFTTAPSCQALTS
jgi:hypothetical protein